MLSKVEVKQFLLKSVQEGKFEGLLSILDQESIQQKDELIQRCLGDEFYLIDDDGITVDRVRELLTENLAHDRGLLEVMLQRLDSLEKAGDEKILKYRLENVVLKMVKEIRE